MDEKETGVVSTAATWKFEVKTGDLFWFLHGNGDGAELVTVGDDGKLHNKSGIAALELEGIDELGLDELDRRFLKTITDIYKGGPVGIEAIVATLGEETDTLVDVVEPYLLQSGLLARTRRGRQITSAAAQHLGVNWVPKPDDNSLFEIE